MFARTRGLDFKRSGTGWIYEWSAGGMLQKVTTPTGRQLEFYYDPLGRRTAKILLDRPKNTDPATEVNTGRVTRWIWDGNIPLHEWSYEGTYPPRQSVDAVGIKTEKEMVEDPITWVFEPDSFVPCARLQSGSHHSIITDYLGTPTHAYDQEGKMIWERELDIYGATLSQTGTEDFIPYLYQGQYLDTETGLAYNRFRYYDPESGNYISQDPIGLNGGLPNFYGFVINVNWFVDVFALHHGLSGEIIRNGESIFNDIYQSGSPGSGRLNQQEALLTHTERKFLTNDAMDMVQAGDHLKMVGQLNPCTPGCQPAIRRFVNDFDVSDE